jgi:hypothetical protein
MRSILAAVFLSLAIFHDTSAGCNLNLFICTCKDGSMVYQGPLGKKQAKRAWPIHKRAWHSLKPSWHPPNPRLAHAKVGGGRDQASLGRAQAKVPPAPKPPLSSRQGLRKQLHLILFFFLFTSSQLFSESYPRLYTED